MLFFRKGESLRRLRPTLEPVFGTTVSLAPPINDYRWLVSPAAEPWLGRASAATEPLHRLAARFRRQLSPARTHLVLEQVELRRRAAEKFTGAARMFFTRTGLQQATDEHIAAYKAARFGGRGPVIDVCCGIGGDLLGLTARGPTVGVDRNPICAVLAAANTRHAAGGPIAVRTGLAEATDVAAGDAWHIDPDRRASGRRTTRTEWHQPSRGVIERLLGGNPNAAVKLAPAAMLPGTWCGDAEREWISRGRECRQLVVWFGRLAGTPGRRRATVLGDATQPPRTLIGHGGNTVPEAPTVGRYLFEPDPAVLAAGLTAELASPLGLAAIAPECVYLTGDHPLDDGALACFEVTDVLPLRIRRLKRLLRERSIGRLEIKCRGLPVDPQKLRGQLRVPGDRCATLLLARTARRARAVLAQRVRSFRE